MNKTIVFLAGLMMSSVATADLNYSFGNYWDNFHAGNYEVAVNQATKAAEVGDSGAMYFLFTVYGSGRGVPLNVDIARKYLCEAVRGGEPHAMNLLGEPGYNWLRNCLR